MKKIDWHNPANVTPPEGYRLLIPEEVDDVRIKGALIFTVFKKWVAVIEFVNKLDRTYAVPQDTPLPEGYAVIDGEPWQMDGWTLNVPGVTQTDHLDGNTCVEVIYRNTVTSGGSKKWHWFGVVPEDPGAEIIGWRVVEQEEQDVIDPPTKPSLREEFAPIITELGIQTFRKELQTYRGYHKVSEIPVADRAKFKAHLESLLSARHHLADKFLENFKTSLKSVIKDFDKHTRVGMEASMEFLKNENQRLKNELADAQATLKSIRSLLP